MGRPAWRWMWVAAVSVLAVSAAADGAVTGRVFEVVLGEQRGIANVVVSDGYEVVVTDAAGWFTLEPSPRASFVFVSVPNGFRSSEGWYRALDGGSDIQFPLQRVDDTSPLVFVQISDIHFAPNPEEFSRALPDRVMVVRPQPVLASLIQEINAIGPDFVIVTGDIAAGATLRPPATLVASWMEFVSDELNSRVAAPIFAAMGDHDVVFDGTTGKHVYERYFGPTYYSFSMKGVHFVVINPNTVRAGKLVYSVSAEQVAWLERDLQHVHPTTPIIVFSHRPTPDWAATPENADLLSLLERTGITAVVTGHWHSNFVLRSYPYLEITSGAVSGSWWEGEAPDGSEFGYRVFRIGRGRVDSIWREIGRENVDVSQPAGAIVTWHDTLRAAVWGEATGARWKIGSGPSFPTQVVWNGLWSTAHGNLNFSIAETGFHVLSVEFTMADGSVLSVERPLYVANPNLTLRDMKAHEEVFAGRVVAVPKLEVRAVLGAHVSASDGTETIIIGRLPFPVARKDRIGIMGLYRLHVATLIRPFDPVFFIEH